MRRIALLVLVLSALLATGCGQYGKRYDGGEKAKTTGDDAKVSTEPFDAEVQKRDGCTDVQEFESEGHTHVDTGTSVKYEHNPPMSGDHWNDPSAHAPADWGLYDETLKDEQIVHNLEHGHIVISFKGLSTKEKDEVYDDARINDYHLLVYPRDKNPKKGVYYTAWTKQIYCKHPSKAALQEMIDNYRDAGPELFTDDASGGMTTKKK